MPIARTPLVFLRRALGLFVLAVVTTSGCRFLPNEPYWIEALGHAQALRVSAWPSGALAIGTDHRLYGYPGPWARPWAPQGPAQDVKSIAASQAAVYAIEADGQVARFTGGAWVPYAGSATWGASELGATEDDRLLVIVGSRLRRVEGADLKDTPCGSEVAVVVAGVRGDEVFVLDPSGVLHHGQAGACTALSAPVRLQRIAAATGRLVGVAVDGSLWRYRDGAWKALPAPVKYRPGRWPFETRARDVAVSLHNTFIIDDEGSVFVLSDES